MSSRLLVKLNLTLWTSGAHSIRHNLLKTIFDIFVPVAFFLLMTVSRAEYEKPISKDQILRSSFEESFFTPPYGPRLSPVIAYSPNTSLFNGFIAKIEELHDADVKITHIGVDTAQNLERLLLQNRTIIAGIQFNHPDNVTEIPENFNFSLRFPAMMRWYNTPWPTDHLYKEQMFHRFPRDTLDWNFYRKEGFVALQFRIISTLHVTPPAQANRTFPLTIIEAKEFPDHPQNLNFDKFQYLVPSLTLICFYYTYLNTVCCIVAERRKHTIELMKLMGISNWFYWLSVYLQKILLQIVSVTIIIVLMKTRFGYSKAVFEKSEFFFLWEFFVVYCTCFTSLAFLLSLFFTDIRLAISVATIIWFASFLPFSTTHINLKMVSDNWKTAIYFLPNSAMGFGIKLIFQLELMLDSGLDSSTLWNGGLFPYDILSIGKIISIMLYTTFVFLGIFFYLTPVFPGKCGVAAPIYYLFTEDFWSTKRIRERTREKKGEQREDDEKISNFEKDPENHIPGIRIKKLTKAFVKGKSVLRSLSLNIYKNEITVLCGPNACGKTTLMLILTGMLKATSGVALINGYDINKKTNSARKSMGFCPQQNMLLDGLTAREQLLFYSLLKGCKTKTAYADMKKYSKQLQFDHELDVATSKLSYGTQRKLSIAIAFCGKSQFVFLDHPSHSLDPAARQLFWNFLASEKQDRHILLTTHLPDEVDAVADRIAYMTNGELKFYGSSTFVRQRYGAYRLLCVKDNDCKSNATTKLLDQYFPGIAVETETKGQLSYLLSYDNVNKFGRFFEKFENFYETKLKLKSFRFSIATTEFLFSEFARDPSSIKSLDIDDCSDSEFLCGIALLPRQVLAMLMKRIRCGIRKWQSFVFYQLVFIILMVPIVYDLNVRSFYRPNPPPPFEISLDSYNNSHYCFIDGQTTFADDLRGIIRQNITNAYRGIFGPDSLIVMNATEVSNYASTLGVQKYRYNFLIGVTVRLDRYVHVNTFSALHAYPISLKHYMISRLFPAINVTIINQPLTRNTTIDQSTGEYLNMEAFGIDFPVFIGILVALMSSEHILFYIKEKQNGTKIKQYTGGVNHSIFWLTSIVWDSVISLAVILTIVVWMSISERVFWSEMKTLYIVASMLFICNLVMVPIVCLFSLIFSEPATGVNALCALNMFSCMMIFANHYGVQFISAPVKKALSVIPVYGLTESLVKLTTIEKRCRIQCDEDCDNEGLCETYPVCCPSLSILSTDSEISSHFLFMTFTGLTAFLILLVVEHEISKQLLSYAWNFVFRLFTNNGPLFPEVSETDSKDSINELISEDSVGDGRTMNSCFGSVKSEKFETRLNMHKVSKYYGRRLAVDEITLTLQAGECVGLIGKNGKGKTTIFKMLTGEQRICYGEATLFGMNLKWKTRNTHDYVGYCPQSDQLWDDLTVRETLRFFCMLRGAEYDETVDLAHNLNLRPYFNRKVSRLSDGIKQILSIVIALVGYPTVILIDGATGCIDDRTKRILWTIFDRLCSSGKSILLSADSMQEYQTLCTRFTLEEDDDLSVVECEPASVEVLIESDMDEYIENNNNIVEFMKTSFKEAKFRSAVDNLLTFELPYSPNLMSKLFMHFEKRRRQLSIVNFYVSLK